MPLLIVDYVRENYAVDHGGLLRRFLRQEMRYLEGQVLEVYEGEIGRERVRTINRKLTCIFDHRKVYLPRDEALELGIAPRTWIALSVLRVGDPRRDLYYPVYPGRINVFVPWKSALSAKLEELFFKAAGLNVLIASLIYRSSEVLGEVKDLRRSERG